MDEQMDKISYYKMLIRQKKIYERREEENRKIRKEIEDKIKQEIPSLLRETLEEQIEKEDKMFKRNKL